ncbi:MAG: hypothetical protein WAV07_15440 [Candidatus Contendobacter sp.]
MNQEIERTPLRSAAHLLVGHDMKRGAVYFAGLTKTKLTETIRAELSQYGLGQEFESKLISDLIAHKHYYCSRKGLRPERFKKEFRPGAAYDFYGFFSEHGWHLVSWFQCITPRDELDWLKRALREVVEPIVHAHKIAHPTCERCRLVPSEHVDHVEPEFDVMATKAIQQLTPREVEEAFSRFDWWSKEPFTLPAWHRAVKSVIEDHKTAIMQAVCQ